ncbi:cytochrome b/b6 domain-containing protein [Halomonas sp. BM-2019]|uniref:cytochrome b n=1 Tax=Halomonas sp. BM-2019 TaxID=2811227 RepID=UPI001B3C2AA8|nr:MAG: cytochrome b/b6 domain-containing protein [Halomonas sp. BM-2019]
MSETDRYADPHRVLHWLVAAVLLLSLASGLTLGFLGFEGAVERFGRSGTDVLYTGHKSLGVALLAHPMLGWAATASGDFPVQFLHWHLPGVVPVNEALSERLFEWHGRLGWGILGLVTLHITGALYHWLIRRDNVMKRMSLF